MCIISMVEHVDCQLKILLRDAWRERKRHHAPFSLRAPPTPATAASKQMKETKHKT